MADAMPEPAAPDKPVPSDPASSRQTATLVLVTVGSLLVALSQTLLIPVLPKLAVDLHTSATGVEWLLTATLLVGAIAVPVFGRLGDMHGKRLMLLVCLGMFVAGSLISALTSNLAVMIVGRAVVGLSIAAIPLGISLVGTVLPAKRAGSAIALISATLGVGGALGLPIAALIAEHANYHVLFWICVVGGVLAFAGIAILVPEPTRGTGGKLDLLGTVLLAFAMVALLLPLAEASAWGWGDIKTYGLLIAAVILIAGFIAAERRIASPVVDMAVNARPPLLLTNIASLCVGFALFATLIGTASYVQAPRATGYGFGASLVVSGLCLLPSGIFMLLLSPVSARISARSGPKFALALGAAIVGIGFLVRIFLVGHLWEIVIGTSVAGAGTGIAYASMPSLILRGAPRSELAAANGLNSLARSVGSSLSSAIGGTILAAQTITLGGFALPSLAAYRTLFAICAAAAIVGAVIALAIPSPEAPAAEMAAGAAEPAAAAARP